MLEEILQLVSQNSHGVFHRLGAVQSFSAGALGFSFGFSKAPQLGSSNFRIALSTILDVLENHRTRLVIMIDEIQNSTPEMREFVIAYQHLVTEDRQVALLMAGLPASVYSVLNDDVLTFLRRAKRVFLKNLDEKLVEISMLRFFANTSFDEVIVKEISKASSGYPYFIQLLGYYLWNESRNQDRRNVTDYVIEKSKIELFQNVHELVWSELSNRDKEFVEAMCEDVGVSNSGDVMQRMGIDKSSFSKYRQRLINGGVVEAPAYGKLIFTLPYFREYVTTQIF
jgi:hypothetical protein